MVVYGRNPVREALRGPRTVRRVWATTGAAREFEDADVVPSEEIGSRAGTEVAQLYVGHPASDGEPPHQLKGFRRITLNPGQAGTVTFTVTAHDLAHWDTGSGNWIASAGGYQILVGDSSRNLPLTGNLNNPTTVTANAMD